MGVQEELLFRNVALAYATLCDSLGHMRFAEHVSVNEAAHELALQCLLPVAQMRHLIKCAAAAAAAPPRPAPLSVRPRARRARYLYYDVLLSYAGWQRHEQGDADSRSRSISALTSLLAEHLCSNAPADAALHAGACQTCRNPNGRTHDDITIKNGQSKEWAT